MWGSCPIIQLDDGGTEPRGLRQDIISGRERRQGYLKERIFPRWGAIIERVPASF